MSSFQNYNKRFYVTIFTIILFLGSISIAIILDKPKKKENYPVRKPNSTSISNNGNSDKFTNDNTNTNSQNNQDSKKENSNTNKSSNSQSSSSKVTNNIKTSNSNQSKPSNTASNSNTNSNKPTNSNTTSNSNTNSNTSSNKPVEPPKNEDKNNSKRKSIEKAYGVKILYGNEIGSYKPKGITPTKLTNDNDIENYLNRLNTELAKYPKNFFQDFNKKGMPLTIYLIKSANGAFSGFTDYQFMNDIKLTLTTDFEFEYTFHHEIMHYIDCYLNIVMYPKTPYEEFEALNPKEFQYGKASSSQIYNMANNPRGAYFISKYGASNVAEDRAEIFKYMTARAYAPIGCFEKEEIIRKKAIIISKQIKTYFPSVTTDAHWDRFIK